jgi:hypothetical protein
MVRTSERYKNLTLNDNIMINVVIADELAELNLNIKKLIWVLQDPKHENRFTRDNLFGDK